MSTPNRDLSSLCTTIGWQISFEWALSTLRLWYISPSYLADRRPWKIRHARNFGTACRAIPVLALFLSDSYILRRSPHLLGLCSIYLPVLPSARMLSKGRKYSVSLLTWRGFKLDGICIYRPLPLSMIYSLFDWDTFTLRKGLVPHLLQSSTVDGVAAAISIFPTLFGIHCLQNIDKSTLSGSWNCCTGPPSKSLVAMA